MFLDTSGLFCLLDRRDPLQSKAAQQYAQAKTRVSHSFVLAELVALGNTRKLPSNIVIPFVETLISRPEADIVWVDEQLTAQALILLNTRLGAGYSLCDAVSFILMRQRGLTAALTTDSDFQQEGFQRLLA